MISVIIPVYNVEDYLHICLNCILKQTYQDFEIICIDDGSTDSSLEILEYFAKKDSRIKILKNDSNRGPGFSRNRGLEVAKGKYISFLDGDDWLSKYAFEILINKSEENNLDLLMFKNIVYYEEPREFKMEQYYDMKFMNKFENKVFNHFDLDRTKLFVMPNAPWNKFYLKSFLDENNIRFPNENLIHEDNPFFYKVITSARRISLIDNYLHIRRRRPNSIMTYTNERLFDNIDICYLTLDIFLENHDLYRYYKKEILTHIAYVLNTKYYQIEDQFKDEFFKQAQGVYKNLIVDYGLYNDILKYVNKSILDKFKFNEIVESINSKPKISVIIPVYNVENYLNECLDSVVNQTFEDIEIITVDDGSTDKSLSILKKYWRHDSRFTIISQENKGLSAARNAGLKIAKGEYIYFLDSDDYIELDALQELYAQASEKDLDMVLFKTCCFYDESKEKFTNEYFEMSFLEDLVNENIFSYGDLNQKVYDLAVTMGSTFFKRDLISDLTFPEGLIFEDNPFFIEAILNAKRVFFFDKYLYHKRERKDSITVDGSCNFEDIIEIRNIIIDLAWKNDNFYGYLYAKKFKLIKFRFLQTSDEFKGEFFSKIKQDFENHKEEYESSQDFQNLADDVKSIFYAGLNAKNYNEFEDMITGKIKISVIMPVYNKQEYVSETLQSIENQTLTDIEVICVDDGSTDNSIDIIENFNNSFKLKILKQDNSGPGIARNKGLEIANGEYIAFLDADDLFEDSQALEKMYNLAKSTNADMVSANLNRGDTGEIRYRSYYTKFYEEQMVIKPDDYEVPFYFGKNIFKNSFLRKNEITFPNLEMGEDPVFLAEILAKVAEIPCLPLDFYYYRISETLGLEKMDTPQKKKDYIKHFKDTLTILKNEEYNQMFSNYVDLLVEFISHPNYNSDSDVYNAFCREFGDFPEIFDEYIDVFSVSEN